MHLEAHAGLGWAIGVLTPGSDRRLRNCCVAAAVLPDVDAVAYLAGPEAYNHWHHTFGHNVFLGLAFVALCVGLHRRRTLRRRGAVAGVVALTFASHLLTDAYFTRYPVYLWWPLNRIPYSFAGGVWLGAPINTALVYGALVLAVVLAVARGVTPLDVFWPRLDRIVRNAFRAKPLACATCEAACNERCDGCEQPTCLRHGRIGWGFRIACPACGEGPAG